MPKLLFFSYKFPPLEASCCIRAGALTKYLTRDGWDITVVTPDPMPLGQEAQVNRRPPVGLGRLHTGHRWKLLVQRGDTWTVRGAAGALCRRITWHLDVENSIGWMPAATSACRGLTAGDVDVILATGPPFVTFQIAARVARRLNRPYVLDYRDPWTGNPHRYAGRPTPRRTENRERRLLQGAAAAAIVSQSWARQCRDRFDVGNKLQVIGNGFDPEELAYVRPRQFGHFAIVYAGVFYPPKRTAEPVMEALRRFKQRTTGRHDAWRFHYFGPHGAHVFDAARRVGVEDQTVLHGMVTRSEAVGATKGADVAVVVTSTAEVAANHDLGIVTGKIYEPVGLGTPVLLIAPAGSDARNVVPRSSGGCFTARESDAMAGYLLDRLDQTGTSEGRPSAEHSWPELGRRYSALLSRVITGSTAADPPSPASSESNAVPEPPIPHPLLRCLS